MRWSAVLDELMRERGSRLYGYAFVLTGDSADAEDLLQDALVRTFRRGRASTDLNSAHAYVKRAITTAFLDDRRRARRRPARGPEDIGDLAVVPAAAVESDRTTASDATADLHAALLTLPPRERACVVLRHLEDLSVRSIAGELDLAEGTVKRYLSDGLARLRTTHPDLDPGHEPGETSPLISRSGGLS
ncbi:RNA polymerase sigma factor [Demequina sp. NBRC 110054]|uniref:RNA polymerase sigma factor n=1 Tax=Demequina sp. NBRC 110054 TaxID=1570343 RepID=UPI0009FC4855|nr:sigma-70 family RNA polymerase sigma factor [Demequina sp. NBRC 110054]